MFAMLRICFASLDLSQRLFKLLKDATLINLGRNTDTAGVIFVSTAEKKKGILGYVVQLIITKKEISEISWD